SGNAQRGVLISGATATANQVLGNFIGTQADHVNALISTTLPGNTTINSATVTVATADLTVGMQVSGPGIMGGTSIGSVGAGTITLSQNAAATQTAVPLKFTLGNGSAGSGGQGVYVTNGAHDNVIGGSIASGNPVGTGNVIAYSSDFGVLVGN